MRYPLLAEVHAVLPSPVSVPEAKEFATALAGLDLFCERDPVPEKGQVNVNIGCGGCGYLARRERTHRQACVLPRRCHSVAIHRALRTPSMSRRRGGSARISVPSEPEKTAPRHSKALSSFAMAELEEAVEPESAAVRA